MEWDWVDSDDIEVYIQNDILVERGNPGAIRVDKDALHVKGGAIAMLGDNHTILEIVTVKGERFQFVLTGEMVNVIVAGLQKCQEFYAGQSGGTSPAT